MGFYWELDFWLRWSVRSITQFIRLEKHTFHFYEWTLGAIGLPVNETRQYVFSHTGLTDDTPFPASHGQTIPGASRLDKTQQGSTTLDTQWLRQLCLEMGADDVGLVDIDRLKGCARQVRRPQSHRIDGPFAETEN